MNYLIFDGNYLLMKAVFTLHKQNRLYGDLWTLLDNNILKYTAMNTWDKVIVVSDSRQKSWRKKILDKYKANRVKQEDIDWEYVFQTYSDWKDSIRDKYVVLEKDHIEGDDWIGTTIAFANKQGKSCVTISSDQDLYQLVNYKIKKNKSTINIQINDILGSEKVIVPEGWKIWLNEFSNDNNNDVFCLNNTNRNISFFNYILNTWQYEEVNAYACLFQKIIMGDKSDNIDSIYQKATKTGKLQNIGKAGAAKLWNFYKENFNIHYQVNDQFFDDVLLCLEQVNNLNLTDGRKKSIKNNIVLNSKIIQLHYRNYPEWVLDEILTVLNDQIV